MKTVMNAGRWKADLEEASGQSMFRQWRMVAHHAWHVSLHALQR